MRTLLTIVAILLGIGVLSAQEIREGKREMTQGTFNSYTLTITSLIEADDFEDLWEDYLDDAGDADKVKTKKDETFADNATIETVSDNTIDIYSRTSKVENQYSLTVWFDLGGAFLSSSRHGEKVEGARQWLRNFANLVKSKTIEEDLEAEEDKLDDLSDEMKDLENEVEDLKDDIKSYEKKIEEAKEELTEKQKELAGQKKAVEMQKNKVEEVKQQLKKIE